MSVVDKVDMVHDLASGDMEFEIAGVEIKIAGGGGGFRILPPEFKIAENSKFSLQNSKEQGGFRILPPEFK